MRLNRLSSFSIFFIIIHLGHVQDNFRIVINFEYLEQRLKSTPFATKKVKHSASFLDPVLDHRMECIFHQYPVVGEDSANSLRKQNLAYHHQKLYWEVYYWAVVVLVFIIYQDKTLPQVNTSLFC